MKKDFITITPDNGTGDSTITVQADSNSLLESRSAPLTIGASGISKNYQCESTWFCEGIRLYS